jgi:hypothetical protein
MTQTKPAIEFWKASILSALLGGAVGAFLALLGM